jgi:hypothetical protein
MPLCFAVFKFRKSMIPVCAAIVYSIALPWCSGIVTQHFNNGVSDQSFTYSVPNLLAHTLVAVAAVFVIWWGVRLVSRALVNLGIVWFALAVGWFYYSDIFDKVGRSLGLIGLGVLFLAGGWALEKTRRGLLAHMSPGAATPKEAQ